jgi:hypothetical protein
VTADLDVLDWMTRTHDVALLLMHAFGYFQILVELSSSCYRGSLLFEGLVKGTSLRCP